MNGRLLIFFLITCGSALVGCAPVAAPQRAEPGPLLVATGIQTGSDVPASYILPTGSLAEAHIPRGERMAAAPGMVTGGAFTDTTYDAQPIGIPSGYGYRYRRVIRYGVTLP